MDLGRLDHASTGVRLATSARSRSTTSGASDASTNIGFQGSPVLAEGPRRHTRIASEQCGHECITRGHPARDQSHEDVGDRLTDDPAIAPLDLEAGQMREAREPLRDDRFAGTQVGRLVHGDRPFDRRKDPEQLLLAHLHRAPDRMARIGVRDARRNQVGAAQHEPGRLRPAQGLAA